MRPDQNLDHRARRQCLVIRVLATWITVVCLSYPASATGEWFYQNPRPSPYRLAAVSFADAETGMVITGNGLVLRTDDGGITWTPQGNPGDVFAPVVGLIGLSVIDHETAVVVGNFNFGEIDGVAFISRTEDGGDTWDVQYVTEPGTLDLLGNVSCSDTDHCTVMGIDFSTNARWFLSTTDGGVTWVRQSNGVPSPGIRPEFRGK